MCPRVGAHQQKCNCSKSISASADQHLAQKLKLTSIAEVSLLPGLPLALRTRFFEQKML